MKLFFFGYKNLDWKIILIKQFSIIISSHFLKKKFGKKQKRVDNELRKKDCRGLIRVEEERVIWIRKLKKNDRVIIFTQILGKKRKIRDSRYEKLRGTSGLQICEFIQIGEKVSWKKVKITICAKFLQKTKNCSIENIGTSFF